MWWYNFKDIIRNFFWEYHSNNIYGPGFHSWRKFKSGNLGLLISIITLLILIIYLFAL